MGNKILIELDKARIKEWCKLQRIYPSCTCPCSVCKLSDKELIECVLMEGSLHIDTDYKIKEQNNEIKPKFKIGDKIFALKEFEGVDDKGNLIIRTDIKECIVNFINIGISKRGMCIKYTYDLFPEEDCFATKDEAQVKCNKRIKGE